MKGSRRSAYRAVGIADCQSSAWAPKTIWTQTAATADTIATWPLREGRTPWTVLLSTLTLLLFVCVQARRGLGARPSSAAATWVLRSIAKLLGATLAHRMGEGLGVKAGQKRGVRNEKRGTGWRTAAELETQNPKPETELTARAGPLSDLAGVTVEQAQAA